MPSIRRYVSGALAILALAGCTGDAVTTPSAPERGLPKASVSNGIHVSLQQPPGVFAPGQSCVWEAYASGGDPYSYTYSWSPGGSWHSPQGELTENWSSGNYWSGSANSTGWYWLTVTVTDAYGRSGSATASGEVALYLSRYCD